MKMNGKFRGRLENLLIVTTLADFKTETIK
jgi:hypothetical protein